MSDIIVSICCLSYNHEPYIKQCLDGFVMQKCNFIYEVLIHDDASTDKTASIIKEYEIKYPDIIKPIYQTENQYSKGIKPTFNFNIPRCKGKYIAFCEGDDYWTDPLKLQKQVDFLEQNDEYILCFHKVNILKPNGQIIEDDLTKVPDIHETIEDLASKGNYIHTPTVLFRNINLKLPDEFFSSIAGDYFVYMLLAKEGKIKYIDEKMAVYREGVGVWSNKDYFFRNFNTNYVFCLLISVFANNSKICSIFLGRLKLFLTNYESQLTTEKLNQLGVNDQVRIFILDFLHERNQDSKKRDVNNYSFNSLFLIILKKSKNKLLRLFQ